MDLHRSGRCCVTTSERRLLEGTANTLASCSWPCGISCQPALGWVCVETRPSDWCAWSNHEGQSFAALHGGRSAERSQAEPLPTALFDRAVRKAFATRLSSLTEQGHGQVAALQSLIPCKVPLNE